MVQDRSAAAATAMLMVGTDMAPDRRRPVVAAASDGGDHPRMLRAAIDLLVPPLCWACRSPARAGLCDQCHLRLEWIEPRARLQRSSELDEHWSPLAFDGPARSLVHALKFHSATALAGLMAKQIVDALPPRAFPPGGALVPVPAHPGRRRSRGFDHAELLARELSPRVMLPLASALARRRASVASQRGLGRSERLAGHSLDLQLFHEPPKHVVLVDDVCTTGATLEECARVLRNGGSRMILAVTYSRVK
ncbi:MAG: hypothetical protein F2813_08645 [Actinobacteria bacterium]|nr:hypothetical protein [Actinomycetota bacterium]